MKFQRVVTALSFLTLAGAFQPSRTHVHKRVAPTLPLQLRNPIGLASSSLPYGPPTTPPKTFTPAAEVASTTEDDHHHGDWLDKLNHVIEGGAGSGLLISATALSIALANSPYAPAWLAFWNAPTVVEVGGHALSKKALVNEGLMAFFFFHVGIEIKKEIIDGSLSNVRNALLPCIAALGGMVVPVMIYAIINLVAGPAGNMAGACVPMATDIAFAMGVFALAGGRKLSPAIATFLLTLATVDDIGAILVIATCFATNIKVPYLLAGGATLWSMWDMERKKVPSGKAYIFAGVALWYCLLMGGVNADIAGVLAGLCIYCDKGNLQFIERLVRRWIPISGLFIMPVFALANTAIPLVASSGAAGAAGAAAGGVAPVAGGILAGLTLGKPLGIVGASWLAVKMGWASYPKGMGLKELGAVGFLGGIGFTMCIFLIEQALAVGPVSTMSKIAVISGSVISAAIGGFMVNRMGKSPQPQLKQA